jgi:Spy/CpxP family protein refolding chaperone
MRKPSYFALLLLLAATMVAAQNQNESAAPNQEQPAHPHPRMGMNGFMGMPPLGDWWRNSGIAQQINLSDQQKQQLGQIFSSHRENLVQLRGNVETEENKLGALLDQDQPQQDQVLAEVTQLQAARNALEKEFTVMSLAFRGVLSPDQWKQLRYLSRQKMMNFRMHKSQNSSEGSNPPPPQN